MAFVERTTAPDRSNPWFYDKILNPYCKNGFGLPNCTCYAWGRFSELTGKAAALFYGNAEDWYNNTKGYAKGQTPRVGAVICWRKGKLWTQADGAGHVAVVERVNADGSIVTSNSNYGGTLFYRQTLKPPYALGSPYAFLGFIYPDNITSGLAAGTRFKIFAPTDKTVSSQQVSEGLIAVKNDKGDLIGYNLYGDSRMARSYDDASKSPVFEGMLTELQPGEMIASVK